MELIPPNTGITESVFKTNDNGMFNASSLAKQHGKDVYGYTRGQKVKDLVKEISIEYGYDPEQEFTDKGNIVRVISGGTAPGTWMHLDIFLKFLGWLDPKLERDFFKGFLTTNRQQDEDPLQSKLAITEAEITALKKKLARNPLYKNLIQKEKEAKQLQKEIDRQNKSMRKHLSETAKKVLLSLEQPKP